MKPKEEESKKITEALNKGQLAMVYGEVEHGKTYTDTTILLSQ